MYLFQRFYKSVPLEKLPDYGTLDIQNYQSFLDKNKTEFNKLRKLPLQQNGSLSDYTIVRHLEKGAFGSVLLVKDKATGSHLAMKTMSKESMVKNHHVRLAKYEKIMLNSLNFPFIISIKNVFMDNSNVYFILPFISGGNIYNHLRKAIKFDENLVRFYGAQVVLGLEYLHFLDVVYRDLKPENILVDHTGYVKITDFGLAKVIKHRTYTICGTPEYIAPEVIARKGYGKAADWWSLGILLFEMASGSSPFFHNERMKVFVSAASLNYEMPNHFSSELKDLVGNILQTDQSRRFGNLKDGVKDIKEHKWFRPIVWSNLLNRKTQPPFIPEKSGLLQIQKSKEDIVLKIESENRFEKEFQGF